MIDNGFDLAVTQVLPSSASPIRRELHNMVYAAIIGSNLQFARKTRHAAELQIEPQSNPTSPSITSAP